MQAGTGIMNTSATLDCLIVEVETECPGLYRGVVQCHPYYLYGNILRYS